MDRIELSTFGQLLIHHAVHGDASGKTEVSRAVLSGERLYQLLYDDLELALRACGEVLLEGCDFAAFRPGRSEPFLHLVAIKSLLRGERRFAGDGGSKNRGVQCIRALSGTQKPREIHCRAAIRSHSHDFIFILAEIEPQMLCDHGIEKAKRLRILPALTELQLVS